MKNIKIQFLNFALFLGFFAVLIFGASSAHAATLYIGPSSGNFTVGNILNVSVLVNSQGQAINNSGAVLNFPARLLEVVSVSKSGSIFTLWVEEPAFSNVSGTVSFDGGLPTPGFNGTTGKVVDIAFRIRDAGTASLVFASGAVRANDGYGTDVLTSMVGATYNLQSAFVKPIVPPPVLPSGVPAAPLVSSPTHPDSNKWYPSNKAIFEWSLKPDITAARILVNIFGNSTPTITYRPPVDSRDLSAINLEDGVWYFHVQLQNDAGWGGIAHKKFQIDTANPVSFNITEIPRTEPTDPVVHLLFEAFDEKSGIDFYEIRLNDDNVVYEWRDDGTGIYKTDPLDPGDYTLFARAVDKAGNSLADSIDFSVGTLNAPVISDYPQEAIRGDILTVTGTTYPDSEVTILLQKDNKEPVVFTVGSDGSGSFTFTNDKGLDLGTYKLWAKVTNKKGASSGPSEEITFVVKQRTLITIGTFAIGFLSILIPLLALLILLLLMLWYSWYRFSRMRKKLKKEVREAETALHKAFDLLKDNMREQLKMLEKVRTRRELTDEEEKIIKQLRKDLTNAEKLVQKEMEDIKREIE